MNTIFSKSIPAVFTISLMLLFSSIGSSNIYGQGTDNATQSQTQQQPQQQNQTSQSNQTSQQQQNQTSQQSQQPQQQQQLNQSKSQDSKMIEQLLNYTNIALIELENDDSSAVEQNLLNIQQTLLNATDKQVMVVPAPMMDSNNE